MKNLQAAIDFLSASGSYMPGLEMTDDDAIELVMGKCPDKPFCLVRRWAWIDLVMPEAALIEVDKSGRKPVVMFANMVVMDSKGRFCAGDWVRSTLLVSFSSGCIFETSNTAYVLIGAGQRKSVDASTVLSIF